MRVNGNGDTKLLERIRKLLNLAEGTRHKDEAEAAMLKAQLLLAENGWEIGDVPGFQDTKTVLKGELDTDDKSPQNWQVLIAGVIAKNFRLTLYSTTVGYTKNWRKKSALRVLGLKSDVEIGQEVIQFAWKWFDKNFKSYTV